MKKHKHLVAEFIERISSEILDTYRQQIKNYSKGRNGIYALYSKDDLYYVGLASSLSGRLNTHLKDRHKGNWDRFSMYLTTDYKYLKEIESLILRIIMPEGNRAKGRLSGANNLIKELKRDLKHSFSVELDFLTGRRNDKKLTMAKGQLKENQTELVKYGIYSVQLRARYKGKLYKARVDRNGWVIYRGKKFPSLSAAGIHILGRSCNGWTFWTHKSKNGTWEKLDRIR